MTASATLENYTTLTDVTNFGLASAHFPHHVAVSS